MTATARPPMTAVDARTFPAGERISSIIRVASALAERARLGCQCQPYADVFTFARWIAQGRAVRKGEHGIRLTVYVAARRHDAVDDHQGIELGAGQPDGRHVYPRVSFVFCRCQTDTLAGAA